MRFSFGKIWAAAVCLLVFASCAKDTSESYAGIEQRSLDAWMKLHRPELLGNRQEARGFSYYVDVLDAGSTDKADTLIAETDCWVQYEFTARDLNGNVCMTRNAVQAKQQVLKPSLVDEKQGSTVTISRGPSPATPTIRPISVTADRTIRRCSKAVIMRCASR